MARKFSEEKLQEISKMMQEEKSFHEIAEKFFNKNVKRAKECVLKNREYFKKFKNYLAEAEQENNIQVLAHQKPNFSPVNISEYNLSKMSEDDLKQLSAKELTSLLVFKAPELLMLLQKEKIRKADEEHLLTVPMEIIAARDKKNRTLRISEALEKQFDQIVAEYEGFTKTDLLNFAIKEFIDKYGKK